MISLGISGCYPHIPEPVVTVEHVYHYTPCAVDEKPNYVALNLEKHIGSADNVNILIGNLEVQKDYGNSLNTTIECYEEQIEKTTKGD
jgi:hypothetical protein